MICNKALHALKLDIDITEKYTKFIAMDKLNKRGTAKTVAAVALTTALI